MENIADRISVITICLNCCADVERTVQSVRSQTYANIEFIVVDGGSTDGTLQVLEKYRDSIHVLISESDAGIYDALNKGVRRATGEWILCLNAGDVFASDDVLQQVFSRDIPKDKTVLYSDFFLCRADGSQTLRHTDRSKGELHHQNLIYRRELHRQYGYYVVTHPYIVSDLLFFLAIPETDYLKLYFVIAHVKAGGISDNPWCTEQAWAAKMIYGMDTIPGIFLKYVKSHIFQVLLKIKKMVYGNGK